jgi:hypothetical protein
MEIFAKTNGKRAFASTHFRLTRNDLPVRWVLFIRFAAAISKLFPNNAASRQRRGAQALAKCGACPLGQSIDGRDLH